MTEGQDDKVGGDPSGLSSLRVAEKGSG